MRMGGGIDTNFQMTLTTYRVNFLDEHEKAGTGVSTRLERSLLAPSLGVII